METSSTLLSTNNVIDYSYIEFHTKTADQISSKFLVPFADETSTQIFGTLTIKVSDTPMTKTLNTYYLCWTVRSQ